jgi:hypothetical protein
MLNKGSVVRDDDSVSLNSADEALCEILGITSLTADEDEDDIDEASSWRRPRSFADLASMDDVRIASLVVPLSEEYQSTSMCIFPSELTIPAAFMRRITDEVIWDPRYNALRTYETIHTDDTTQGTKRELTRLENLNAHPEWNDLCNNYLRRLISATLQTDMVLFKSKLNLKPPGGNGFAPHVDAPSLSIAFANGRCDDNDENNNDGPRDFVTVMVAIDDMTELNGCLRVCRGPWSQSSNCKTHDGPSRPPVVKPTDDNPDAGGRAGAIPLEVADTYEYTNLCVPGGTIVAFHAWAPHRSGPNRSNFARRAVFLTYNPRSQGGDCHDLYYAKMQQLRDDWRKKVGLATSDENFEMNALATIPRI